MTRTVHGTLWGLVLALVLATPALADIGSDTGPGCGLGKLAWGGASGKHHIAQQVLASTTNGTFGSQTFGISFGTSGCTNDGVIAGNVKVSAFADANLDHIRQDMAQGHGEYLTSLAALLGVPVERQGEFFALTQAHFASMFPTERTTSSELLVALNQELSGHPELLRAEPVQASR